MAQLCLGTVQFGMKYGINNTLGQPSLEQSLKMLETAAECGISVIDTAKAYGTAENVLGEFFLTHKDVKNIRVISKLCPNIIEPGEKDVCGVVRRECENSLKRIHLDHLDGYLFHTPEYIYRSDLIEALVKLKEEKLVSHIGVSIYELREGDAAIAAGCMDYIQLPYSILDQRGIQEDFIGRAKQAGITIFTRSAFLQGLFMMDKSRMPSHLRHVMPYLDKFDRLLKKYQADKAEVLLQFVLNEPKIDYLVFGVDTREQLLQNIEIAKENKIPQELIREIKESFTNIEKSIIFPSLWSNGKKVEQREKVL